MTRASKQIVLALGLMLAARLGAAAPQSLLLVDDRGEPLPDGAVTVCFRLDLDRHCSSTPGPDGWPWPAGADAVEIEGPDHGPVRTPASDLTSSEEGPARVVVPRKATLRVRGKPEGRPVTLSLYRITDPDLRIPALRFEAELGETLRVPAGEFLISISAATAAPDLHPVDLPPAGRETIRYVERPGWSLVVRAVDDREEAAVAGVEVTARPLVPDNERPTAKDLATEPTARSGLAIFPGLDPTYVDVVAHDPRFVDASARGISASPGTFAVRELRMRPGGSLRTTVSWPDTPAAGVLVEVMEPPSQPSASASPPAVIARGETNPEGDWRADRVPPGTFTVHLSPPESDSHAEREVTILDREETELTVDLEAIEVTGTVYQGLEGAGEGYRVEISPAEVGLGGGPLGETVATATTDSDGRYQTTVWESGSYEAFLLSPDYVPITRRRVELFTAEDEVDFHLEEGTVAGRVVDEDGEGIEGAMVLMTWNGSTHHSIGTLADGSFSFPVDSEGTARLEARKAGFERSETREIEVTAGTEPHPVVLVLPHAPGIEGVVRAPSGHGLAGVSLASFTDGPAEGRFLGATESGPDGAFELPAATGARTRVFAVGLTCPLTWIDAAPAAAPGSAVVECPAAPATLVLRFADASGEPSRARFVRLRRDGVVIPEGVLRAHLARLGLPIESDGQGRLVLPSLTPGHYDLFLESGSSAATVAAGDPAGYVASAQVLAFGTTELEVVVENEP